MTAERRPWWMDVVAASFLILTLFNGYLVIRGPALADGLDAAFEGGALHVRSVEVETPFAKAGLQSGDQILAVNDLPMLGRANGEPLSPMSSKDSRKPGTCCAMGLAWNWR